MIHSVFNQFRGDFDYFEAPEDVRINDDLPVPQFGQTGPLGVSSLMAGRPLPKGAKPSGRGKQAKGRICMVGDFKGASGRPVVTNDPSGLSGLEFSQIGFPQIATGLLALAVGYFVVKKVL